MKLTKLSIKNFRKLQNVEISIGDATFLIGANNAGKSSTLSCLEYLLGEKKLDSNDRSRYLDSDSGEEITCDGDIIIEGEFRDVSEDIINERGFNKDRLFSYTKDDETKGYGFKYRVRYTPTDNKMHREIKLHVQTIKEDFLDCKCPQDYIDKGIDAAFFGDLDLSKNFTAKTKSLLDDISEIHEMSTESDWFENPGGIPGNVLSKLPRYLKIEASSLPEEINEKTGSMQVLLNNLFEDVKNESENYKEAKKSLDNLAKELDPSDDNKEFGKMMGELNRVVDEVFPNSEINVSAQLSGPESLKPKFEISMKSNVNTDIMYQGTGMIRSVVFALLKYRQQRSNNNGSDLIIGFEEPELFLHPNAANSMRDTIYDLAVGKTQIISTTHSPYMIDISKEPKQVLNSYSSSEHEFSKIFCFNHSKAFNELQSDDKSRIKMIQKIDDYVSRVFFAEKVVIVEGNTEDLVFKKTIEVMPEDVRKEISSKYQIIKANGKATMISFIKYLLSMNVDLFVVHDEDSQTKGAVIMNQPILDALENHEERRYMMHNCIEDEIGYSAPSSDKPYKAYKHISGWNTWNDVPDTWKNVMKRIFSSYSDSLN
ncbi:ATP-dependent nuclease [Segatella bryantii]|jgi:predicted ATP-dependent endonuclease of OLD family|uniref:ATP-dependent nuclease n=1 Tax=Segatella bryantii TaxID=77095 RepID=UPI00242FB7E0|nr:AAA family ATPase [Segatella bryantii]